MDKLFKKGKYYVLLTGEMEIMGCVTEVAETYISMGAEVSDKCGDGEDLISVPYSKIDLITHINKTKYKKVMKAKKAHIKEREENRKKLEKEMEKTLDKLMN